VCSSLVTRKYLKNNKNFTPQKSIVFAIITTWLLPVLKKQVVLPVLGQKTLELLVDSGIYVTSLLIFRIVYR